MKKFVCIKCFGVVLKELLKENSNIILILEKEDKINYGIDEDIIKNIKLVYNVSDIDSIEELTTIVEDIKYRFSNRYKAITCSEYGIFSTGFINTILSEDMKFLKLSLILRNKAEMKKIFKKINEKHAKFNISYSYDNINDKVSHNLKYPIIAKPICGMGSLNTKIIKNERNLKDYFTNLIMDEKNYSQKIILEEFVDGEEYHAEVLFQNEIVRFISVSKNVIPRLAVFNNPAKNSSYTLKKEEHVALYNNIINFHVKFFKELNLKEGLIHTEFFISKEGIYFSEIAMRCPGGNIRELLMQAYNVDILKEWAKIQLGIPLKIEEKNLNKVFGRLNIIPKGKEGVITLIPNKEEFFKLSWIKDVRILKKTGEFYIFNDIYDPCVSLIIEAQNEKEFLSLIDKANSLFNITLSQDYEK